VLNHLQTTPPSDDQQAQVGDYFVFELSALLQCLREISQQWQLHLDQYLAHSAATSYVAPTIKHLPHKRTLEDQDLRLERNSYCI